MQELNGILLVDKPQNWTSFDVVHKIRNTIYASMPAEHKKKIKVGHSGTLDPLATGLLVVLVGNATKMAQEYTKQDKTYEAVAKLGFNSETDDEEGEKQEISKNIPTEEEIKTALDSFKGETSQIPPQFSAIKVGGKKAYDVARRGGNIKLEPRLITVESIELNNYEYPLVSFTCDVSSGTYIRSMARDLGENLGTGAYLNSLRRTRVGKFNVENSIPIKELTLELINKNIQ